MGDLESLMGSKGINVSGELLLEHLLMCYAVWECGRTRMGDLLLLVFLNWMTVKFENSHCDQLIFHLEASELFED